MSFDLTTVGPARTIYATMTCRPYELICLATDIVLYGTAEEYRQFEMSPEGSASRRTLRGSLANTGWDLE